jgi:hypothetical protein
MPDRLTDTSGTKNRLPFSWMSQSENAPSHQQYQDHQGHTLTEIQIPMAG